MAGWKAGDAKTLTLALKRLFAPQCQDSSISAFPFENIDMILLKDLIFHHISNVKIFSNRAISQLGMGHSRCVLKLNVSLNAQEEKKFNTA